MTNLHIPATDRSPEVEFDFEAHRLRLSGESYPEDVNALYGPIFKALDAYLASLGQGDACQLDFELVYFNSSSAKAIMTLLDKLDDAAARGAQVTIAWRYDPDDETMQELGEEFGEDVEHAEFRIVAFERGA